MRGQLPLEFDHRPALSDEDFLIAPCNREAVAWLDRWPQWPTPVLAIHGPPGCGKTHLARVFMARSGARAVSPESLLADDPPALLEGVAACLVEDAERHLSAPFEEALLHLYNTARETGRHVMLTAHRPPGRWPIALRDLSSRLNAATVVGIGPPDDNLIAAVLVKLFADRQLRVDDGVIAYILARMERSFGTARKMVAAIDTEALSRQRKITVPLVRDVLADVEFDG